MTFTYSKSRKFLTSSLAIAVALTSAASAQDKAQGSKYIGETEKNLNSVMNTSPSAAQKLIPLDKIKNKKLRRLFTAYPDGRVPAAKLDKLPKNLREKAQKIINQTLVQTDNTQGISTGVYKTEHNFAGGLSQQGQAPTRQINQNTQARRVIDTSQIKNRKLKRLFSAYPDGNIPANERNRLPEHLRKKADKIIAGGSRKSDRRLPVDSDKLTGLDTPAPFGVSPSAGSNKRPKLDGPASFGVNPVIESANYTLWDSPKFDGYVLTHEHPTVGMSFGGNYAFAGANGNYKDGIMENGYTAECSGCGMGSGCDHGEVKGGFSASFVTKKGLGVDMGNHSSMIGPENDSFSHIKYSTQWTKVAFNPSREGAPSMKLMVAFALDNELMCENLYYVNKGNGGPGGDGYACSKGDSKKSMDRQIDAIKVWAKRQPWMEVAYSSADAKRIISDGKMAIVIGVESDYAWGAEDRSFDPVNRLNHYYDKGVRTFYMAHKINSRLAGADIYGSVDKDSGQAIRANQAIANCFYVDDSVAKINWYREGSNARYCSDECEDGGFHAGELFDRCQYKYSGISEANMGMLIKSHQKYRRDHFSTNGFVNYPEPPNFTGSAGSRLENKTYSGSGQTISVERNNLGLSQHGENVIREAMRKGMIMNLDHISSRAREGLYDIAMNEFDGYPLNALHNIPNDMSIGSDKLNHPHEYDMDPSDVDKIIETDGIFGVMLGPRDAAAYPDSGVTLNCPQTVTETAKILAYLLDKGVSVGYSLDLSTVTKGALSRTFANCSNTAGDQLKTYKGHVTNGLTHIGTMENFHAELKEIGLKKRYRTKLEKDGVRNFLKMWERSEKKSIYCQSDSQCSAGNVCLADVTMGTTASEGLTQSSLKTCKPPKSGAMITRSGAMIE